MNRERITISLLTDDNDIIEYLHTIKPERTISSYLRQLIRQDMLGNPSTNNLDQLADKIAFKLIRDNVSLVSPKDEPTEITVSFEDKNIIDGLF